MRPRGHISKRSSAFPGPPNSAIWNGSVPLTEFENDLDNYVNLPDQTNCDPNCDWSVTCALDQASPAWLVSHGATSSPPPMRLYSTTGDPVPNEQSADMKTALIDQCGTTFDVRRWLMTYDYGSAHDHAFKYWPSANNDPLNDGLCVSQEVITFLQSH
jgi:hypothetical protein